jgi:hypothetical protein
MTCHDGFVADSDALRSRRKRLHAAGDHSLCRRCGALRGIPVARVPAGGPEGQVDAVAALERQARRLEAACEADPGSAALERELRATLLVLRGGEAADDDLARFDAEFSSA